MIADYLQKVKDWTRYRKDDLYTAAVIFLVGLGSFGLGRLSIIWIPKEPIIVQENTGIVKKEVQDSPSYEKASVIRSQIGRYIGSKSGNSYHLPSCPGALKIKEENKIWFQSKEEAEGRGYRPAGNCPGL